MLPSLTYNNQYFYTEGNGTPTGVFIANNAVHEYLSQADAHETFSLAQLAEFRRARAAEALARARQEIALRGLAVTVVEDYSNLLAAQHRFATAQETAAAAREFLNVTQELEQGREVAHADVLKAQLQYQDRQIDLSHAQLAMEQARLQLALLLFPDFNQDFQVVDNLQAPVALPPKEEAMQMARRNNPELDAALAAKDVAEREVRVAWAGYLPGLTLDYFYGIDATHFAMVIGIVSKNGILLLDADEKFRAAGLSPAEAMIQAGRRRLRPILMTALAAVAGMLPLALAIGAGSQMLQPLALAVIGGIVVSITLSLIITPAAPIRPSRIRSAT